MSYLRTMFSKFQKLALTPSPLFLRSMFVFTIVFVGMFVFYSTVNAEEGCLADIGNCIAGGAGKIVASVLLILLNIVAWMLGIVGQLFNWAMLITVFQFAHYFGNSSGLLLAWGILRDFANIALLFGFIFMGIAVILDLHSYPWKKTLPALIIYAVLLNFSLFAAEAIIDTSNAFSAALHQQATGEDCRNLDDPDECANVGLAGKVLEITGVAGIGSNEIEMSDIWEADDGVKASMLMVGLFFFVLITLFIILVGAIMLISRAVTLMLLMVTSPIGFAGMAIPPLHGFSKKWWDMLINNILFAPVFVLLMLIGLKILEGLRGSFVAEGSGLAAILLQGDVNTGGVFVLFALAIGFMYAALTSAKQFGVYGAKTVVGQAEKAIGGTVGALGAGAGFGLFAAPAWAARNTLGRGSDWASRSIRRSGALLNIPVVGGMLQKAATGITDYGATATYDGRGTGLMGNALGKVGGLSKATKTGQRGVAAQATKDRVERITAVTKARKEWIEERGARAKAKEDNIKNEKNPTRKKEREKDLEKYNERTQRAFVKNKQDKLELKGLQAELRRLNDTLKSGTLTDKEKTDTKTLIQETNKKAEGLQTDSFVERYADSMAEMADILKWVGYDVRGMRRASVELNKGLKKTPNDKLMEGLTKALKESQDKK